MPQPESKPSLVLTVNGGSSSVKFALFDMADTANPCRVMDATAERVGTPQASLRVKQADGSAQPQPLVGGDAAAVARALFELLQKMPGGSGGLASIAHRVVHGGPTLFDPQRVTPDLLRKLREVAAIDPDHLPSELQLIEAFTQHFPGVPEVVCFDTAFHRDLPTVAKLLPLPRRFTDAGMRRFGFHGLSYTYLLQELGRVAGPAVANGRVVLAHLGSGASLAAVHGGKPIDTTMSFTPTAGLVMGTRTGDLDPGAMVYLMRSEKMAADQLDQLINHESGLKGVSGGTSDVRDLSAKRGGDVHADEALRLFCYTARKQIAAMAAAMGGLDTLVFAGGIGENMPALRAEICEPLAFLGVTINPASNERNADVLSTPAGAVQVRRIETDEQIVLARAAAGLG